MHDMRVDSVEGTLHCSCDVGGEESLAGAGCASVSVAGLLTAGRGGTCLHASVLSSALVGVDAFPVEVEIDIGSGVPPHRLVGLAEGAVKASLGRVQSGLENSRFEFPTRKLTT